MAAAGSATSSSAPSTNGASSSRAARARSRRAVPSRRRSAARAAGPTCSVDARRQAPPTRRAAAARRARSPPRRTCQTHVVPGALDGVDARVERAVAVARADVLGPRRRRRTSAVAQQVHRRRAEEARDERGRGPRVDLVRASPTCTTRPRSSTATRSPSASASAWSCVTSDHRQARLGVQPADLRARAARAAARRGWSAARRAAARAGGCTSPRASATRWRSPPLSCAGLRAEQLGELEPLRRLRDAPRALGAPAPRALQPERDVGRDVEVREQRVALEDHRDARARRARRRVTSRPPTLTRAGVGALEPGDRSAAASTSPSPTARRRSAARRRRPRASSAVQRRALAAREALDQPADGQRRSEAPVRLAARSAATASSSAEAAVDRPPRSRCRTTPRSASSSRGRQPPHRRDLVEEDLAADRRRRSCRGSPRDSATARSDGTVRPPRARIVGALRPERELDEPPGVVGAPAACRGRSRRSAAPRSGCGDAPGTARRPTRSRRSCAASGRRGARTGTSPSSPARKRSSAALASVSLRVGARPRSRSDSSAVRPARAAGVSRVNCVGAVDVVDELAAGAPHERRGADRARARCRRPSRCRCVSLLGGGDELGERPARARCLQAGRREQVAVVVDDERRGVLRHALQLACRTRTRRAATG